MAETNLAAMVAAMVDDEFESRLIFAQVKAVAAGGVTIRKPGTSVNDGTTYKVLGSPELAVDDWVFCIVKSGSLVVLDKLGSPSSGAAGLNDNWMYVPIKAFEPTSEGTPPVWITDQGAGGNRDRYNGYEFASATSSIAASDLILPPSWVSGSIITPRVEFTCREASPSGNTRFIWEAAGVADGGGLDQGDEVNPAVTTAVPAQHARETMEFPATALALTADPGDTLRVTIVRNKAAADTSSNKLVVVGTWFTWTPP